jgi:hypothetical protein
VWRSLDGKRYVTFHYRKLLGFDSSAEWFKASWFLQMEKAAAAEGLLRLETRSLALWLTRGLHLWAFRQRTECTPELTCSEEFFDATLLGCDRI